MIFSNFFFYWELSIFEDLVNTSHLAAIFTLLASFLVNLRSFYMKKLIKTRFIRSNMDKFGVHKERAAIKS